MRADSSIGHSGRVALAVVIGGYLAVTVAESILAPLFPSVTEELGMDLETAGLAFGSLTGSIAVGNLVGGWILARAAARPALVTSLALTTVGCVAAALSVDGLSFVVAQTLIGAGTGVFFAPGIHFVGRSAAPGRRGRAMGWFGVAFSGGLAIAALLAALGAGTGWRVAFWVAAAACLAGTVSAALAALPGPDRARDTSRGRFERVLAVPVAVGSVGTVSQYGSVGFMALFAVSAWGLNPAAAALLIAAARFLSVPGKLLVGFGSDRWGTGRTLAALALCLGATGVLWTMVPARVVAIPAAVIYAAAVSGLFPIANVLALDEFGDRGGMLGLFRSAHIAVGAFGAWVIGVMAAGIGLDTTLRMSSILPLLLLLVRRGSPAQVPP